MIRVGNTALPIVHAEIDFIRPIFCGQQLEISLNTSQVNNSEFAIAYEIIALDDPEQIVVKAETKHVSIDPQIRQRIDLPATILEWLNC